ncbi:MAG: helix-turn-helix domain-containing protein [Acidiferrobacterales bacterium]|nr:helix-turn-helix domain-containing protein [Acidiferrobacterales bacterium]
MSDLNIFGLIDAVKEMEQRIAVALFYSGLRLTQYRALTFIDREENVTVTDLSRHFGITRASASALANELIKKDALVAIENPEDRRSFFLKLTHSGSGKLAVGRRDVELVMDSIASEYDAETVQQLNRFVEGLG